MILYKTINCRTGLANKEEGTVPIVQPSWWLAGKIAAPTTTSPQGLSRRKQEQVNSYQQQQKFRHLFPSMVVSRLARENDLNERENHRFVANL